MATEKRLIYADSIQEVVKYLKKHLIVNDSDFLMGCLHGAETLADVLTKLPPVDAVEVVRCKYCKWRNTKGCPYMRFNSSAREDFDFCSDGERESGGGSNGI